MMTELYFFNQRDEITWYLSFSSASSPAETFGNGFVRVDLYIFLCVLFNNLLW